MKNIIIKTLCILGLLFSFSCEEYLDAAPESVIEIEDVFKNFDNMQGFVEEMYALVTDYQTGGHQQTDYLYGDDATINNGWQPMNRIDKGELGFWIRNDFTYLNKTDRIRTNDPNDARTLHRPGVYNGSLLGIRKANIAIENIDLLVNATEDEKNVILGQAYFFRAFFHLEIMKFWGRYPYVNKVLVEDYNLPRPDSYRETALAIHEDFKKAAELLPVKWDDETYGQKTFGENKGRVTKGAAYGYMGKNLLFAASPLMKGSTNTYDYDSDLAAMAVDAFAELLKLADQGTYALSTFENYEEVFWDVPAKVWPGGTEFIFNSTGFNYSLTREVIRLQMDSKVAGGGSKVLSPTHNFIHYNFGMANGLSVQDDMSGNYGAPTFDPAKPFENRDPRFYKWITVNGDVLATKSSAGQHKIAQLYEGGLHRNSSTGSETGYFFKKYYPTLHSKWNRLDNKYTPWRIRMRLTDIYLMYAEALLAATNSAVSQPASYNLSAEQAINMLRDRAGIPQVHPSKVSDPNEFMDELRRERSVELSFEAHRWVDIRRWVVAHLDRYKTKTGVNFPEKDPNTGTYSYFEEFVLVNRVCDYPKHYWLPFEASQTQIYDGFPQNPGW
ncbi:Starch-binding associating with outer membrane [Lutibacter agarilyticus]|uniref:Starch-binding associating with outer membrane n=1 Tax=Lutibacter agarilyticus TaxID=1109740 RepID=A0A238Y742_9FLAO|nr:RagB/SusD family nutrient uptake outer membrane protein [Lutibacter agarilyticus]SNR66149.1 Starch-binding associating with outer membrane [Lutibacter agarilyticus]